MTRICCDVKHSISTYRFLYICAYIQSIEEIISEYKLCLISFAYNIKYLFKKRNNYKYNEEQRQYCLFIACQFLYAILI